MASVAEFDTGLALRLRIDALMADYVHCIDDDRLEDWPGFFTEDATYRVTSRENHSLGLPVNLIYCEGRGMFRDRISALRRANIYEPHTYCHMTGALRIVGRDGTSHRARSTFAVIRTMSEGEMSVFACGQCFDRVVEEGGALKFRERVFVLDSRRIDTLLAIPF